MSTVGSSVCLLFSSLYSRHVRLSAVLFLYVCLLYWLICTSVILAHMYVCYIGSYVRDECLSQLAHLLCYLGWLVLRGRWIEHQGERLSRSLHPTLHNNSGSYTLLYANCTDKK
jgi:hypothetical protein